MRRLTPWATTTAVPTVAAVRATGAPTMAARRIRRRASGMSGSFEGFGGFGFIGFVRFDRCKQRLDRDAATRDQLAAGMTDRRGERGRPEVLPHEHACG